MCCVDFGPEIPTVCILNWVTGGSRHTLNSLNPKPPAPVLFLLPAAGLGNSSCSECRVRQVADIVYIMTMIQ